MKSKFIMLFFLLISISMHSQEIQKNENSLENQFNNLYKTSSNYQIYKVIEKDKFLHLKTIVLDSIEQIKKEIDLKENEILLEKEKIKELTSRLNTTKTNLDTAILKENSISFFGSFISKKNYGITMWSIIVLLTGGLFFFLYKFKNSHVITKEAEDNLYEVEQEFEKFRKKTLLNEQKLRRQIQDEINKQRKQ